MSGTARPRDDNQPGRKASIIASGICLPPLAPQRRGDEESPPSSHEGHDEPGCGHELGPRSSACTGYDTGYHWPGSGSSPQVPCPALSASSVSQSTLGYRIPVRAPTVMPLVLSPGLLQDLVEHLGRIPSSALPQYAHPVGDFATCPGRGDETTEPRLRRHRIRLEFSLVAVRGLLSLVETNLRLMASTPYATLPLLVPREREFAAPQFPPPRPPLSITSPLPRFAKSSCAGARPVLPTVGAKSADVLTAYYAARARSSVRSARPASTNLPPVGTGHIHAVRAFSCRARSLDPIPSPLLPTATPPQRSPRRGAGDGHPMSLLHTHRPRPALCSGHIASPFFGVRTFRRKADSREPRRRQTSFTRRRSR